MPISDAARAAAHNRNQVWYAAHREGILAEKRVYYEAHREERETYRQKPDRVVAHREESAKRRRQKPEIVNAANRRYMASIRVQFLAAYGGKCVCCGETEPMFLTIDHIDNNGYLERKASPPGSFYGRIVREDFPKKYQLLCYNCNVGKHRNGGSCPHQKGSTTIPSGSTPKRAEVRNILKRG